MENRKKKVRRTEVLRNLKRIIILNIKRFFGEEI